jgi:two-component system invasion response regulator UvrY
MVVEARQLVRAGIERVLNESERVSTCVGVTGFDEAVRHARQRSPRFILASLSGAAVDVLDGVRKILRQFPEIDVLVLSGAADAVVLERLLHWGVAGVVDSDCPVDEFHAAIATVMSGKRYISDSLARELAQRRASGRGVTPFDALTHRELQILLLVVEGRKTSDIASQLCLTVKTVNRYRNRLLDKLRLRTEVALLHFALGHGLISVASRDRISDETGKHEPVRGFIS